MLVVYFARHGARHGIARPQLGMVVVVHSLRPVDTVPGVALYDHDSSTVVVVHSHGLTNTAFGVALHDCNYTTNRSCNSGRVFMNINTTSDF